MYTNGNNTVRLETESSNYYQWEREWFYMVLAMQ
jgi:hypothetical protein